MPGLLFPDMFTSPGVGTVLQNTENMFWWGRLEQQVVVGGLIVSTAADSSQSPTNYLRAGTLLARVRSTGKLTHWRAPAEATEDGEDQIYGILALEQQMDQAGTNVDRFHGAIMVAGNVMSSRLIVAGTAALGIDGHAQEFLIRSQMADRFLFDDDAAAADSQSIGSHGGTGWRNIANRTASYTVLEADNNTLFHNLGAGGAVTFTLPVAKVGLRYGFYSGVAAQNVIIAAPASNDSIVGLNDIGLDTITISTANEIAGAFIEVVGALSSDGTTAKWLAMPHLWEAQTVTLA